MIFADCSRHALLPALLALTSMPTAAPNRSRPLAPVTIALASTSVVGGVGTKATITLATVAPSGGTIVTVAGAPPVRISGGADQVSLIGQIGPTSIRVPQGATQVTLDIFTAGVATLTTSTITAKSGTDSSVASLTIRPASIVSMSLSPATVTGGQSPSLHIVLDGAAPSGTGIDAPLTVSQGAGLADGSVRTILPTSLQPAVNTPAPVHFPPGSSTLDVPVKTNPVLQDQSLTLTAQLGKSVSAGLTIKAPVASSLSLQPNVVLAGNQAQALLVLSGPAPGGFVVTVTTNRPDVTVGSPVAFAEGSTSATFNVVTSPTTATSSAVTATVGVIGARTIASGSIPDGTSNTISIGEQTFGVSATLNVVPPLVLQSAIASPATVTAGDVIVLSLGFGTNAVKALGSSSGTAAGSVAAISEGAATISVDQPSIVHLPASVDVASNATALAMKGTTSLPLSDANVTISTTFRGKTIATVVQVKVPPPALELFGLRPTVVKGGTNVIASAKLPSAATSSRVVTLSTDHPELISLPSTITVPVSPVATPFTFRTQSTTTQTVVTVTAAVGAQQLSVLLTITP